MIISRKWCKIETWLQWKTNRKSYVACRMAPLPVTFTDLEGHFYSLKPFSHIPWEIQCVLFTICLHMNQNAHVARNFNCLF